MRITIHTDGGSRSNPGHAAIGFVLTKDDGSLLYEEGRYIGVETNNVAEYTALFEALKQAKEIAQAQTVEAIDVFMDSNLVVQQMNGKFRVKAQHLLPIITKIRQLETELPKITYSHVYREKNKRADGLVNQALDTYMAR